jgi:hypothetical protein
VSLEYLRVLKSDRDYCPKEVGLIYNNESEGIVYRLKGDIIRIIIVKIKNGIEYPATMYRRVPNTGPSIKPNS